MRRDLERRLARLEALIAQAADWKRTVPDWLQVILESEGYVFDIAGKVTFSPDKTPPHKPTPQPRDPCYWDPRKCPAAAPLSFPDCPTWVRSPPLRPESRFPAPATVARRKHQPPP